MAPLIGKAQQYALSKRRMRRLRRAEAKTSDDRTRKPKKARKREMKQTNPSMELAQSKGNAEPVAAEGSERRTDIMEAAEAKDGGGQTTAADAIEMTPSPSSESDTEVEAPVGEVVADLVASIVIATAERPLDAGNASSCCDVQQQPLTGPALKKRRRSLLQDNNEGLSEVSVGEEQAVMEDAAAATTIVEPSCIVDTDPNIMNRGADRCTGLNSDEDPEQHEEPEDEEVSGDDSWDGDWEIGELSDEELHSEHQELPDSIWASVAKDKDLVKEMRATGWEYDTASLDLTRRMKAYMLDPTDRVQVCSVLLKTH